MLITPWSSVVDAWFQKTPQKLVFSPHKNGGWCSIRESYFK